MADTIWMHHAVLNQTVEVRPHRRNSLLRGGWEECDAPPPAEPRRPRSTPAASVAPSALRLRRQDAVPAQVADASRVDENPAEEADPPTPSEED